VLGGKSEIVYETLTCSVEGEFYAIEARPPNHYVPPPKYEDLTDPNAEYEKRREELEKLNRALKS
jgi:hypothetical protein